MSDESPGEKPLAEELREIIDELTDLRKQSRVSRWDIGMWVFSGGLGIAGIVLAPPTGGLSLALTAAAFLLTPLDMAKKIRESAGDQKVKDRAAALEQRIEDLYAKLRGIDGR
ncbi:MAG TPA: hypothetical protein VGO40_11985 [Longimicrobium sp.]|jgi:hypothetical protein|nr:hypothetical protein [Longimicrobium sp.]